MTEHRSGPRVSVVMAVYNGAAKIPRTVESILDQTLTDFEFLIVNDGSTDQSLDVLKHYQAADDRIVVINQANQGLTRSLNVGCLQACGEFVARQDVGDRSYPTRLERQVRYLDSNSDVVAVGVGANRIGPGAEFLGESVRDLTPRDLTDELLLRGTGLLHAAAMYRRAAFEQAGRYREQFRFAQDTDLWLRLTAFGLLAELPEILFEVEIETGGISARQISQQILLAEIARGCHQSRSRGEYEADLLEQAMKISQKSESPLSSAAKLRREAYASYLVGCLLLDRRDKRCRNYFTQSIRGGGPVLRAAVKLVYSTYRCRGGNSFFQPVMSDPGDDQRPIGNSWLR